MNLSVLAWTPYVAAVTLLGSPSPDRRHCAPMAEREWEASLGHLVPGARDNVAVHFEARGDGCE